MDQIFHFETWTMKCIVSGALRKRTGHNESVVHPHLSLTDEDRRKCRHFNLRNLATDLFCFPIRRKLGRNKSGQPEHFCNGAQVHRSGVVKNGEDSGFQGTRRLSRCTVAKNWSFYNISKSTCNYVNEMIFFFYLIIYFYFIYLFFLHS